MAGGDRETVRILGAGDEPRLRAFLARYPDTTLFMQSNLHNAGIEDRGERCQGTYAAAFRGDAIVGVVSHVWNGMMLVACGDAPHALRRMLALAVGTSGRRLAGVTGPDVDVRAAVTETGLANAPTHLDGCERLYRLRLDALVRPPALRDGTVRGRRGRETDLPLLCRWGVAYQCESIGATAGPALEAKVRKGMQADLAAGVLWVAEVGAQPVSMTRFNASTPEAVQVGGVYTPPDLRSRGYAACAVATSLQDAAAEGATRSILFTPAENIPAQRCYEGLGYEAIGGYGLVLLAESQDVCAALDAEPTGG